MHNVSQMQFDGKSLPSSNVYEINVIKKSFAKMKRGLQSFSKFLDHKVGSLMGVCGLRGDLLLKHQQILLLFLILQVVLQMLNKGEEAKLRVARKEVTVVFINIANFKAISGNLDVYEVLDVLTHYFEVQHFARVQKKSSFVSFHAQPNVVVCWSGHCILDF